MPIPVSAATKGWAVVCMGPVGQARVRVRVSARFRANARVRATVRVIDRGLLGPQVDAGLGLSDLT